MTRKREPNDPELWSWELDWYLRHRDQDCGVRSNMDATISTLQRCGAHGDPVTDPYHDGQAPLHPGSEGAFGRDRRCLRYWRLLPRATQQLLVAHYVAMAPEECGGAVLEGGYSPRRAFPLGLEGHFGRFTAVVIYQCETDGPAALARLSRMADTKDKSAPGFMRGVSKLNRRAERAIRAAHREWYTAQERVDEDDDDDDEAA